MAVVVAVAGVVLIPSAAAAGSVVVVHTAVNAVDVTRWAAASPPVGVTPVTATLTGCMSYFPGPGCIYNGAILGYRTSTGFAFLLLKPNQTVTLPDIVAGSRAYGFIMDWQGTDGSGSFDVRLRMGDGATASFKVTAGNVVPLDSVPRIRTPTNYGPLYVCNTGFFSWDGSAVTTVLARYSGFPLDGLAAFHVGEVASLTTRSDDSHGFESLIPVLGPGSGSGSLKLQLTSGVCGDYLAEAYGLAISSKARSLPSSAEATTEVYRIGRQAAPPGGQGSLGQVELAVAGARVRVAALGEAASGSLTAQRAMADADARAAELRGSLKNNLSILRAGWACFPERARRQLQRLFPYEP